MAARPPQRVFRTKEQPRSANVGDVWTDNLTFKRVYSRGGAWENCSTLGSRHPDEPPVKEKEDVKQESGPETVGEAVQVPSGAGEPAPGDGDDGQAAVEPVEGEEPESVAPTEIPLDPPGIDANGSDVV